MSFLATEIISQIWLEGYNSPSTKKAYKIHFSLFCRYHNIDPDSLVQLKIEHIKTMVINYVIHLKKVAKQSSGKARTGELSVNIHLILIFSMVTT